MNKFDPTPKDRARVADLLRDLEARRATDEQERARRVKRSDLETLKRERMAAGDADGVASLELVEAEARRDGRFDDDMAQTVANLAKQHPGKAVLSIGDQHLLLSLARQKDADAKLTGQKGGYQAAATDLLFMLANDGRLAAEDLDLGRMDPAALPHWAPRDFGRLNVEMAPAPATGSLLTQRQAQRWQALEACWTAAMEHVRDTGKEPEGMPAFARWESVTRETEGDWVHYGQRTRGLSAWAQEVARAKYRAAQAAAEAKLRAENSDLARQAGIE